MRGQVEVDAFGAWNEGEHGASLCGIPEDVGPGAVVKAVTGELHADDGVALREGCLKTEGAGIIGVRGLAAEPQLLIWDQAIGAFGGETAENERLRLTIAAPFSSRREPEIRKAFNGPEHWTSRREAPRTWMRGTAA